MPQGEPYLVPLWNQGSGTPHERLHRFNRIRVACATLHQGQGLAPLQKSRLGVLAEVGDKTQIATVALAARYQDLVLVVAGETLGMMLADAPAVFLGDTFAKKVSMALVDCIAAAIFAVLGMLTLFNVGKLFEMWVMGRPTRLAAADGP